MKPVPLEQVQAEALSLSINEQQLLRAMLDASLHQKQTERSIEDIAREQGKRPLVLRNLLGLEPDEADTDNVGKFLRNVGLMRQTSYARELD